MLIPLDAATTTVLTLEDIKAHLKVQHSEHDGLIADYLVDAADYVGQQAELILQPTSLEQRFENCWPCGCLDISAGPVREIEGVTYLDADGVEQSVEAADFTWWPTATGATLRFKSSFSRPALDPDRHDAVRVLFIAGFNDPNGSDGDPRLNLPRRARQAVRMLVGHWYENRGAVEFEQPYSVPIGVETLIDSLRVYRP